MKYIVISIFILLNAARGFAEGKLRHFCPSPGTMPAVDLSVPVDQTFLDEMKKIGVKTIIRYFDWKKETLPGKALRPYERTLISKNGFKLLVVFQHVSGKIQSFSPARGRFDSERSLSLAKSIQQPIGSALYFGVDNGWVAEHELQRIESYFDQVTPSIRAQGYKVGGYGSGTVCHRLLHKKLVDYCWLAQSRGWPSYDKFFNSNRWVMAQSRTVECGGKPVDFNLVSSERTDYGQFAPH